MLASCSGGDSNELARGIWPQRLIKAKFIKGLEAFGWRAEFLPLAHGC